MFLWSFPVQQTTYRIGNQPRILLGMVEAQSVNNVKNTPPQQQYYTRNYQVPGMYYCGYVGEWLVAVHGN